MPRHAPYQNMSLTWRPTSVQCLEPVFLINMPEPLLLLAILQQTRRRHDQQSTHTAHAKDGREDIVQVDVAKARNGRRTAALQRCGCGGRADGARDKGGRAAIKVATAVERGLHERLHLGGLANVQGRERLARLERLNPDDQAYNQADEGGHGDHVARELEGAAGLGHDGGDGDGEGDEVEDGGSDTGCG